MYRSQRLALKYLTAAMVLFGVMVLFGALSASYYINPSLLLNTFNFNTAKILHIDTLILWHLMGFFGAVYWFLHVDTGQEVEGIVLGEVMFWGSSPNRVDEFS